MIVAAGARAQAHRSMKQFPNSHDFGETEKSRSSMFLKNENDATDSIDLSKIHICPRNGFSASICVHLRESAVRVFLRESAVRVFLRESAVRVFLRESAVIGYAPDA
jgi:hypothetical protein